MYEVYHRTPVGVALLVADDTHLLKVSIRDEDVEETTTHSPILLETIKQLDEYFAGDRRDFDLPLNQQGSAFQQTVWQELLTIPYGTTTTYNQQAHKMKNPLAIRAIAAANGKNNLWVIVPCHRVIGSNGSLTGYAGGLWRKQWLLEHEARVTGTGQTKLAF
ncbi:MAG: methylated-DNA--[protein]-cysteine S-methyltransferase [Bacteroidota bacterium]